MKLVTAETMREMDRLTIQEIGVPGIVLMETAGRAVADAARELSADTDGTRILVVCGPGNNGGDGFVAARHLLDAGFDVTVLLLADRRQYQGDALVNLKALDWFQARIVDAPRGIPDDLVAWAMDAVIVDAIFGTGLARPVTGIFADTIDIMNTLQGPAIAVDIPSGIDSDTGAVLGTAFEADLTITFGAAKIGHYVWPGRGHCGDVRVVGIGIPTALTDRAADLRLLDHSDVRTAFPPRPPDSYKNTFGHVAIIGGMPGKTGAAILAGRASIRSGAGLTTLMTSDIAASRIEGRSPDLMIETILKDSGEWLVTDDAAVRTALEDKGAFVMGPGLGTRPGTSEFVARVIATDLPGVVDADALNAIAGAPDILSGIGPSRVITPHPGEAARLLGVDKTTIQAGRLGSAKKLASLTGAVAVLKGAGTIIAAPDGRLAVSGSGTPALAVAGSGDVLSGIIGALLARGIPPFDAACAAVELHGLAGCAAAATLGEYSVAATDLVELIPEAIRIACCGDHERPGNPVEGPDA